MAPQARPPTNEVEKFITDSLAGRISHSNIVEALQNVHQYTLEEAREVLRVYASLRGIRTLRYAGVLSGDPDEIVDVAPAPAGTAFALPYTRRPHITAPIVNPITGVVDPSLPFNFDPAPGPDGPSFASGYTPDPASNITVNPLTRTAVFPSGKDPVTAFSGIPADITDLGGLPGADTTVAGDPVISPAQQAAYAGETIVPRERTQEQVFQGFMAGQPMLPGAFRSGAGAMFPRLQTQWGLQPPIGGVGPGTFKEFLSGGSFLRGEDLQNRLAELAFATRQPAEYFRPLEGQVFSPERIRQGDLLERFVEPSDAFQAFREPYLQAARPGRERDILRRAFDRWSTSWMGGHGADRLPTWAPTAAGVASLFPGYEPGQ